MTINRNIREDRERTKEEIVTPGAWPSNNDTNWLGHKTSSGAARLDALLLSGATLPELQAARGAVREHFLHLEKEHGLVISQYKDIYKINRMNLGITDKN